MNYPLYVQRFIAIMGEDVLVRQDSTSQFRYIVSNNNYQLRLRPESGVLLRPKPTKLQVRYATKLTHAAIEAQLKTIWVGF